jgi:hypothetical protein
MATKNKKKWNEAIAALLSTKNAKQAAAKCSIRYNTLCHWMRNDPEFIALYRAETKSLLDDVKTSLRQLAIPAVEVMQDALLDELTTPLERFPVVKFTLETVLNLELSEAALKTIEEPSEESPEDEWNRVDPDNDNHHEGE